MLSKTDIQKELGKGICIYPLKLENIKENSVNLCAGKYAWAMEDGTVYCAQDESDKNKRFSLSKDSYHTVEINISKGGSVVFGGCNEQKYIILLPMATTLIETNEVLAVGNYIGGTYHSKVGLVSRGVGHIGTMVGPNFSGESLIAFHNISKDLIVLDVGESFVSVIFYYLKTGYPKANPTISGHTDKFSELGISITQSESRELNADWKKQFEQVQREMGKSDSFKELQGILREQRWKSIKKWVNKKNIFIVTIACVVCILLYGLAVWLDGTKGGTAWVDRFWNVGFSGILVSVISALFKLLSDNSK